LYDEKAMTHIEIKRFAACPFSAAIELANTAINRMGSFYLSPFRPLGEAAVFTTVSTPDKSDETRKHDALLIAWRPQRRGIFPDFHGVLTVRPKHSGVWLQLSGEYEPPYAIPGQVFDFVAGRAIAKRTMRRLLDDFTRQIELEYEAEKRGRQTA
jgi:hypothetical protein